MGKFFDWLFGRNPRIIDDYHKLQKDELVSTGIPGKSHGKVSPVAFIAAQDSLDRKRLNDRVIPGYKPARKSSDGRRRSAEIIPTPGSDLAMGIALGSMMSSEEASAAPLSEPEKFSGDGGSFGGGGASSSWDNSNYSSPSSDSYSSSYDSGSSSSSYDSGSSSSSYDSGSSSSFSSDY